MDAFRTAIGPLKVVVKPTPPRFGGSDVAGLMGAGAPFVEFTQDATRYFDLHHSADDTLDKIDMADLAQNVAVWASFVYTVADSDVDFRALDRTSVQEGKSVSVRVYHGCRRLHRKQKK